ncbi:hypothetical protein MKW98_019437 [Papaver atlanticum]|uniref:Uncharacterized protein n=1 Tax=Papaver atlanticum TaxID=357466 RepID=A0AAD4XA34_9MAGN|nr:hypothetical protein MKW98_019437 [Papaver atlanticum]
MARKSSRMNLLMQRMSNRRNLALYDVSELHSLMVQDSVSMDLPTSYDDDNDKIGKQVCVCRWPHTILSICSQLVLGVVDPNDLSSHTAGISDVQGAPL